MSERECVYRLMPSEAEAAAYRAGYERCGRDAATAIKAKRGEYAKLRAAAYLDEVIALWASKHDACDDLLAAVAALNATQEAS